MTSAATQTEYVAPVVEHRAPDPTVHAAPAPDISLLLEPPAPLIQYIDKTVDVPVVQVVQVSHVQDVQNTSRPHSCQSSRKNDVSETRTIQGTQTSESLGTAPGRHVAFSEMVEVVELEPPVFAESAPPMFETARVVEAAPVVVEYVQLAHHVVELCHSGAR